MTDIEHVAVCFSTLW